MPPFSAGLLWRNIRSVHNRVGEFFSIKNTSVGFDMDNASINKEELVRLVNENNHTILFNAPYSPECNTIEMVF